MSNQISEPRQVTYYIGMGLIIVGFLMFASVFVTFMMNFGDFSNFQSDARSFMVRAFGGMGLIILGKIIRGLGTGAGRLRSGPRSGKGPRGLDPTPAWPAAW